MLKRSLLAAVVLAAAFYGASASAAVIEVNQPPYKNPGVVTLGTLSIANRVDFAFNAITSNGNKAGGTLTETWDWGDGTPVGTGLTPNHTYLVAGNYTVTVHVFEGGVEALSVLSSAGKVLPAPLTLSVAITDAMKSSKLQTNEMWGKQNGDSILLSGTVRIPNVPLTGQLVFCDIGGVQLSFVLNGKGIATLTTNNNVVIDPSGGASLLIPHTCKATLKVFLRKRPPTDTFVDSKFLLTFKNGFVQDAFAFPATITNRDANRDNVRITCKITFNPPGQISILYQSGINSLFTSKKGLVGKTR